MQAAAKQLGIELSDWRSSLVTAERVRAADLVVLFDLHNFAQYEREFRGSQTNVLMLGLLADPPAIEVADPYGRGEGEAIRVGRQIQLAVSRLMTLANRQT